MGQLDFPLPYWDNVSDTAKVCERVLSNSASKLIERLVDLFLTGYSQFSSVSAGADHWDATGGGGSEICSSAGAGSPMGQRK